MGRSEAHNAAAARELLRQVAIDVLVLDVHLPRITGLELPRLRARAGGACAD